MTFAADVTGVTFDVWNTLLHDRGVAGWRKLAWRSILAASGRAVPEATLAAALSRTWTEHDRAWRAGGAPLAGTTAAVRALARLGVPVDAAARERLVEAFARPGPEAPVELAPGAAACLARISRAGLRLALVCDVGFIAGDGLRAILDRLGVLGLFDGWAFSDEVGAQKPSPRMFHAALDAMGGLRPERVVHVGDLRRTDVAGARAAGMRTVRYAGLADDAGPDPDADAVVRHHAALPSLLGLG